MDESIADPGPGAAEANQGDPAPGRPADDSAPAVSSRGPLALLRERWKGWLLVLIVIATVTTLITRRVVLSLRSTTAVVAQPQPGGKKQGGPTDPFSFGAVHGSAERNRSRRVRHQARTLDRRGPRGASQL